MWELVGHSRMNLSKYSWRQCENVSSAENLLERNIVLGAANGLGVFPKLAEMSRTAAARLARTLKLSERAYLSHSIVTRR